LVVEAWSAGRVARQEVFAFTALETVTEVYTGDRLSFYDRLRVQPATYPYQRLGLWARRPHLLTLYVLQEDPLPPEWLRTLQEQLLDNHASAGLSRLDTPGLVTRALADDAEALMQLMRFMWRAIREDCWGEPWNFWRK
jgi:urease accessory protein UreH